MEPIQGDAGQGEEAVQRALSEIAGTLPFPLLGVDSDNGSEFINWHLKTWCEQKEIQLTRGRPYKKDDNAHIEQKNWTHVRKLLGLERYDTHEAVEAMNDLYWHELRLRLESPEPERAETVPCGGGKVHGKELAPRAWKSKIDFHFPTATAAATKLRLLRLHLKYLDDHSYGYILKWLDRAYSGSRDLSELETGRTASFPAALADCW